MNIKTYTTSFANSGNVFYMFWTIFDNIVFQILLIQVNLKNFSYHSYEVRFVMDFKVIKTKYHKVILLNV